MTRREMLAAGGAALMSAATRPTTDDISLAAWSLNQSFFKAKKWKNSDLPRICRELNINGLEFVNQFFENPMMRSLNDLKKSAADHNVRLVLIMIDGEGDMAAADKKERMLAARAHRKWVDTAHYLGCHAIRCNLGGPRQGWEQDKDLVSRAAESFADLLAYAKGAGLNVVIENHGGASSNAQVLPRLMKAVDNPDFGTLPDFGNINQGDDHYEVIRALMPWAKGVSVKSGWAADGTHPRYSLEKMIKICQDAGYHGFWGIESSYGRAGGGPDSLSSDQIWENEVKGVTLTRDVLMRTVMKRS